MRSSEPLLLLLLRHEETAAPRGVLYGQTDVPLSERGRERTVRLVETLSELPVKCVYSSDLSRCLFGARLLSERLGIPLRVEPSLRELDFGSWTGLSFSELMKLKEFRERLKDPEGIAPPGGETVSELAERGFRVVQEILKEQKNGLVVVFSHGGLNRALILKALGLPLSAFFRLEQRPGAINLLVFYEDALPVLGLFNASIGVKLKDYVEYFRRGGLP